jgi:hypothetical protein
MELVGWTSQLRRIHNSTRIINVNDKFGAIQNLAAVAYYKVLPHYILGGTEINNRSCHGHLGILQLLRVRIIYGEVNGKISPLPKHLFMTACLVRGLNLHSF